jgi:polyribonucleotide nucleotidyltransferase
VGRVEDVLNVGDIVMVKVIGVDRDGKIKLSRKALLPEPEGGVPAGAGADRGGRGSYERSDRGGDRGGRDRDRGRGRR